MSKFTPTQEQQAIVSKAKSGKNLSVNACAGSGKSSSIVLIADAIPKKKGLYLAFNKAIADEMNSNLPNNVEAKTTHSLAYGIFGVMLSHKLNYQDGSYINRGRTAKEICNLYGIKDYGDIRDIEIAKWVKDSVDKFQHTADETIQKHHICNSYEKELDKRCGRRIEGTNPRHAHDYVLGYMKRLWADRINPHSPIAITHDTYLKLYQLSNPLLNYDVIFGDEFQDTNACVLDIVMKQRCQKVLVGDNHQMIYSFRGSLNAMKKSGYDTLPLSQSWRWGDAIADVANTILQGRTNIVIKGNSNCDSRVDDIDQSKPSTKIYRTNAAMLSDAVMLMSQGLRVNISTDIGGFLTVLRNAEALYNGDFKKVKHQDFVSYKNWSEFATEAKEDKGEKYRIYKMIDNGSYKNIMDQLNRYKKDSNADITLITAHKSKGLEWDQVVIADDFPIKGSVMDLPEMECNLLYVACTRAKKVLQLSGNLADMLGY